MLECSADFFLHLRYVVLTKDFEKGWKAHVRKHERDFEFYSV